MGLQHCDGTNTARIHPGVPLNDLPYFKGGRIVKAPYDVKTLYQFALLVTGSPTLAEEVLETAVRQPGDSVQNLWHQCSLCDPLLGAQYTANLQAQGGSKRICQLFSQLYWDERGLLLLRLLLELPQRDIQTVTGLPEGRLLRLFASMQNHLEIFSNRQMAV